MALVHTRIRWLLVLVKSAYSDKSCKMPHSPFNPFNTSAAYMRRQNHALNAAYSAAYRRRAFSNMRISMFYTFPVFDHFIRLILYPVNW